MSAPPRRPVEPVYSEDRARRLRLVLYVELALAGLLALLSLVLLVQDGDTRTGGVVGLVVAAVLAASGATAVRLLGQEHPRARTACVVTGVLTVLGGLVLAGSWLAFLLPLLGVGLLFLSLVADPDA